MLAMKKKSTTPRQPTPPKKPSELILLALEDLAIAEKSPNCSVIMNTWYREDGNDSCCLCFAGGIMAFTLKPVIQGLSSFSLSPENFGDEWSRRFYALDCLREGLVEMASYKWVKCKGLEDRKVPDYGLDPKGFKAAMRKMAKQYQKIGK